MKKRKRKINKKKIFITIGISLSIVIILSLLFNSIFKEKKELKKLEQEVTSTCNLINQKEINYKKIKKELNNNITTGKRKTIEKNIEKYLLDISKNTSNIIGITKDKDFLNILTAININKSEKDFTKAKKYLKASETSLNKSLDNLTNIDKNKYLKDLDKKQKEISQELISKNINIKEYKKLKEKIIKNINIINEAIEYIEKNKNIFKIEDDKLIITKRKKLEEYKNILNKFKDIKLINITEPTLITDKTPPTITAADINITEGTKISIKDKVKCTDEVDDEIECKITGDYDVNKVGNYEITITATDKSNNTSTKKIKLNVNKKVSSIGSYYTEVIRNQNTVIVYGLDDNGNYTKVVRVMPCSVGRSGQDTPTGTFKTSDKYRWGALYGGVYGQYATRIVSDILFHSVPYYSNNPGKLEWEEYNKLGSPASLGCVRMTVRDVKWIYDNCPSGMTVKIYDGNLPTGISKPSAPKISASSPNKGWDPTDPDPNNPWNR